MLLQLLKGKVHRATVTQDELDYEGSLTLDRTLMERAGMLPHEHVHVWNLANGNRFQTYLIEGPADSGVVCVNGAAAHLARKGDKVIIAAFAYLDAGEKAPAPRVVRVDDDNRPLAADGPELAR